MLRYYRLCVEALSPMDATFPKSWIGVVFFVIYVKIVWWGLGVDPPTQEKFCDFRLVLTFFVEKYEIHLGSKYQEKNKNHIYKNLQICHVIFKFSYKKNILNGISR